MQVADTRLAYSLGCRKWAKTTGTTLMRAAGPDPETEATGSSTSFRLTLRKSRDPCVPSAVRSCTVDAV